MLNISFHIYDVENEALFSYDSILAEAILDLIIVCPILVPIHSQGITYTDRFLRFGLNHRVHHLRQGQAF